MNHTLYKQLLHRVLLSMLFVSLLTGAITLVYQIQQLENYIKSFATTSSNHQMKSFVDQYREACIKQETMQPKITLKHTGFVLVNILDGNKALLFSKSRSNYEKIKNEINAIDHHIAYDDKGSDIKLIHNHIENRFYVQMITPALLTNKQHGYIKVLYRVSDEESQKAYMDILLNVLLAIATVVILFAMLFPIILFLNRRLLRRTQSLSDANLQIMAVLGAAISKRDNETNSHNYRVTLYALAMGEALSLDDTQMAALLKGSFLHDVGKIGISDNILLKPDSLSDEEYSKMKNHVLYGQEIIAHSPWLSDASDVLTYHHEKYDGTGYMKGLKGEEIPLNARIFAIVDVFDALTSSRPYKDAFSYDKSIQIIREKSGTHFDPKLLALFIKISKDIYTEFGGKEDEKWLLKKVLPYTERYL
ncbi:MAG TPA: HD-GYP domain-containing protein [Epsilonproteobacteria bacterium]|nr:HD-GYP domain-containing protein [Campylobacterota bacterium]